MNKENITQEMLATIATNEFLDAHPEFTKIIDDLLVERATNRILAAMKKYRNNKRK